VDDVIGDYFEAWNEADPEQRSLLLERSVTSDAELVDPTGLVAWIGRRQERRVWSSLKQLLEEQASAG
jgi:hypothetical protein